MNEQDFEAQLRADGYTEVESQTLEARPGKGRHRHLFAIRGLVISGTFNVILDSEPVAHGPGQIFSVGEGQLHDESILAVEMEAAALYAFAAATGCKVLYLAYVTNTMAKSGEDFEKGEDDGTVDALVVLSRMVGALA